MKDNKTWDKDLPLGRFLSLLTKSYYGALTKKLENLEMERYYSILITIESYNDKNCSQQSLCDRLQYDKASMVKRIDYLAKMGLVQRKVNPKDRREHCICLTDKAHEIMPDIHAAVENLNNEATKGMNPTEKEQFYQWLQMVYDNISELPAHKVTYNLSKLK
jgi:DNA-binding MarR family transcriptional regulator